MWKLASLLWIYYDQKTYKEGSLGGIDSVAIDESGIIYCGGVLLGAGVCALDGKTGEVIWIYKDPQDIEDLAPDNHGPLTVANGVVYTVADEALLAREGETGRVIWRYNNEAIMYIFHAPSVVDRIVCFAVEKKLFALDAMTGDYRWSYEAEDEISTSPALWLTVESHHTPPNART
ncbi:unnamed protein product [marine sediment metagenome]|uniref:Pyrrolo-quinoline quinone repeat domain-containing protein n=1 Tax=marine sediment metagenome TaxID=412755 RepID=X1NJZ9_9ZZZZ